MKVFLIRHASPDWERRDIPYDIHPGPMLTPKGEKEAKALAGYLKLQGLVKLYHSPFERAARTARIVAALNGIPAVEEPRLAEWRAVDEQESQVRLRMVSAFQQAAGESANGGPTGLVSHGGPIALLLLELGMPRDELAKYRILFDTTNPLPPAGAWQVEQDPGMERWRFEMVFRPGGSEQGTVSSEWRVRGFRSKVEGRKLDGLISGVRYMGFRCQLSGFRCQVSGGWG